MKVTTYDEKWRQEYNSRFDDAEFYQQGTVVSLIKGNRTVTVESEGDRNYDHENGRSIRHADEFRANFPDGQLPDHGTNGWTIVNNGWFAIYDSDAAGIDDGDNVYYSLTDAAAYARELISRHDTNRLEYLRQQVRAKRISYGELHELQGLADQINPGDVELLEAAGVPEFPDDNEHDHDRKTCLYDAGCTGCRTSVMDEISILMDMIRDERIDKDGTINHLANILAMLGDDN